MAYLAWCVLAIMACFLVGTIVNVIEGEKLNVLKPKYRKKHQEGEAKMKDGMERINQLFDEYDFPLNAIQMVRERLGDWFISGGKPTDGYVWQQARYLENLVRYGLAERKAVIE